MSFLLFVIVKFLDCLLTYIGVAVYRVPEGNPIARWIFAQLGVGWGVTAIMVWCLPFAAMLWRTENDFLLYVTTAVLLVVAVIPWLTILGSIWLS